MTEQKSTSLDEETKNLRASVEKAGERDDKTVRFHVKKGMVKELVDANDSVQNGENNIPDSEKNKFGNMLGNVFGVIGDAMEGVDDWWNKPVRDMADGTPQTRGQKWSRRLSKGFDATVDFASDAIQTVCKAFEDGQIEEIIIDLPLLLGKQVLKGLDWLNEWIKGWDLNPKDKSKEQTQEKGETTKNLPEARRDNQTTQNIPAGKRENKRTENIPNPHGKTEVAKPKISHRETQNIPLSKLLNGKSR